MLGSERRKHQARLRVCLLVFWLAAGYNAPGLNFYEHETPDNCTPQVQWSHPTPVLAGRLGFFGSSGDGVFGTFARLRLPRALALDEVKPLFHESGEVLQAAEQRGLYVADAGSHAVRLINLSSSYISTVAGVLGKPGSTGDGGPALSALLREPFGLALDSDEGRLYIADQGNHAVRCLDVGLGTLWTSVGVLGEAGMSGDGGPASLARLRHPASLALHGRLLLVADAGNGFVRSVNLTSGEIDTLQAPFSRPTALALDASAGLLYVADAGSHTVWRLALEGGGSGAELILGTPGVSGSRGNGANTFHGYEGNASGVLLKSPVGLAFDPLGQRLYVADSANPAVRVMDIRTETVALALGRSGYYDHDLSPDDTGAVGLALAEASLPGFRVLHRVHNNFEGRQRYGKYFYFNSSNVPGFSEGVHRVRQYRDGVLIWVGLVQFYPHRLNVGPTSGSCEDRCNAQGVRYPEGDERDRIPGVAEEGQWELDDIVLAPELHAAASQPLYLAEGHNFVVRTADMGVPTPPICHTGSVSWEE